LAVPGAVEYSTFPSGLNNLNQVAGYYADADGNYHGFIEQGVLQGQWDDANYAYHGFVATTRRLAARVAMHANSR